MSESSNGSNLSNGNTDGDDHAKPRSPRAAPAPGSSAEGNNEGSTRDKSKTREKDVVFEQIELDSEDSADSEYRPSSDDDGDGQEEGLIDEEMRLDFSAVDREELQFEVDVLHSSDEEQEQDKQGHQQDEPTYEAQQPQAASQRNDADTATATATPSTDPSLQSALEQQIEDERKAYIEFLAALYAKDNSTDQSHPQGSSGEPQSQQGVPVSSSPFLLPDDDPNADPNFDYLTAAALFPEDTDEYRDDPAVRVSPTELSDLISSHHPSSRPVRAATRKSSDARPLKPKAPSQKVVAAPSSFSYRSVPGDAVQLDPLKKETLKMQMATHIQLLLHLHVHAPPCSPPAVGSAALLQELIHMRDVTLAYKRTFAPYSTIEKRSQPLSWESLHSFFDTPILGVAPSVLAAAAAPNRPPPANILAACGVSSFVPSAGKELTTPKVKHSSPDEWSETEDGLLAHVLHTRGMHDAGESTSNNSKWSLLPHRTNEECEARVKHLSSRRARDNVVKRVVLKSAADEGLSKDEWQRVKETVSRVGEGDWERVAREAFVNKRPNVIEREWRYRERKRLAKKRERTRAKQRRESAQAPSASST